MDATQLADLRQRVENAALIDVATSFTLPVLDILDLLDTIDDLKTEVADLRVDVGDLQDDLDDYERRDVKHDDLKDENAALRRRVEELEEKCAEYKNDASDIREAISDMVVRLERGVRQ